MVDYDATLRLINIIAIMISPPALVGCDIKMIIPRFYNVSLKSVEL